MVGAFFEAYSLRAIKVDRTDEAVRVTYEPASRSLSIADVIYGMNRLPRDANGNLVYDAGTALRELAERRPTALVNRELVKMIGTALYEINALAVGCYGEPEELLRKWAATGGQDD